MEADVERKKLCFLSWQDVSRIPRSRVRILSRGFGKDDGESLSIFFSTDNKKTIELL